MKDDPRPASPEAAARLARAQRHALLFRRLVDRCGGVPAIVALGATRLSKPSQLYRFTDPGSGCFAPADVIEDLELLCGEPVYSAAVAESLPASRLAGDLLQEACETSVSAAELMRVVLAARASPGGITPRIRAAVLAAADNLAEEVRDVRAAAGEGPPCLRPVEVATSPRTAS